MPVSSVILFNNLVRQRTRVVEKQRVVWFRILHQPVHRSQYVLLRWLTHWILLIVRQDDHIFSGVSKVLVQVSRHVLNVIDTSPQLSSLAKVVDAYEKGFPSTRAR